MYTVWGDKVSFPIYDFFRLLAFYQLLMLIGQVFLQYICLGRYKVYICNVTIEFPIFFQ